jgi:small-conductance mechanosensitive channel
MVGIAKLIPLIIMKKTFSLLILSLFAVAIFAQDLKNPRLTSTYSGATTSSGNNLLFVGYNNYIQESDVELSDVEDLIEESQEQKRQIENLTRQLAEQQRKIDELIRKVK